MASPISIVPLEIATWAQRAVAGPQTIALVIALGMGNGETRVSAELAPRERRADRWLPMTAAHEASIAALPTGPRRDLEVATWAKRIASGPRALAFVVSPDMPDEAVEAIANLPRAVRREMGGAQ